LDSADEMKELKEHAEEAHERGMLAVSLTMAVLAVIIALFTMMGHRAHTEEVILQNKVTDQWSYYQAKNIQRAIGELGRDLFDLSREEPGGRGEKARSKFETYNAVVEKHSGRQQDIDTEARKLEDEVKLEGTRATRFDYGESLVAIALVITSVSLMTRKRGFWVAGAIIAVCGLLVGSSAFTLR
jgi:hypothetical protein